MTLRLAALLLPFLVPAASAQALEPTFEQILANPDDVELNARFAKRQIAEGDLKGAASTLERVLMVSPRQARLRLLYAMVLIRLENLPEAERELRSVLESAPESVKAEARSALNGLEKKKRRLHIDASFSLGFEYDQNRNASPSAGQRLFLDTPIQVRGAGNRQDDTAVMGSVDVGFAYDLPYQAGHQLLAGAGYLRSEQTLVDTLDLQVYSARVGAALKTRFAEFLPTLNFDHVLLSEETFLRNLGGGLRAQRKVTPKTTAFIDFRSAHQDFQRTSDIPLAFDKTGNQTELGIGARRILSPKNLLAASYTRTHKEARRRHNAYTRDGFSLAHTYLLGSGRFWLTSLTANFDRYEAADRFVSNKLRNDDTFRLRGTFGTPLAFLHPALSTLLWTAGVEYYHGLSSLVNYAYDDTKVFTLATYRWGY